mgnify:CR=1 FL=1
MSSSALMAVALAVASAGDFWAGSRWLSVPNAPEASEADRKASLSAPGTSWFSGVFANGDEVVSAKWMIASLGVFEAHVNGRKVGNDFLAPGFTHPKKTKYAFTYDITRLLRCGKGEANLFTAQVSSGWWRDQVMGHAGEKSALRCVIELTYADGSRRLCGSNVRNWKAGVGGPVVRAGIFDGEEYDAREQPMWKHLDRLGTPEVNREFAGEILPSAGAEVTLRHDRAMARGPYELKKGESLVVDFGQNASAVPFFRFRAKRGTVLTALPAEMLNDADAPARGCDGKKGTIYRANLRVPEAGMRVVYTFSGDGLETYHPRFTFFGYRYLELTATDDVTIESVVSVPVTSIRADLERGRLTTGVPAVNKLISNTYWGQLSNYLSVPTDCPQRNERLGWTADTQVFAEAGSFNADTRAFFGKWMRDMRDSQDARGSFPGVAPAAQYGGNHMRFGWADAGVIVPYVVWRQFGDRRIVDENWSAMERFVARVDETKYDHEAIRDESKGRQWADWLSYEPLESRGGGAYSDAARQIARPEAVVYWNYLGACYWLWDARMMAAMAKGTGRNADTYRAMSERARAYLRERYFASDDGMIIPLLREMQTPALFALKLGLVEGAAKEATVAALRRNFAAHGGCLQTGFLGTSILMDTLTENGMSDLAYDLLLQHGNPSWLYSVDQGATTVWERWNSYTKEKGFGPVEMNSFNHYAYGAVLAWMYRTMAGIAADPERPGFENIIMRPVPDRRLGPVTADYRTPRGTVRSAWRYEGDEWIWDFTVPEGSAATVVVPGEREERRYGAGRHQLRKVMR